ncbi:sensor histidine kinase [Spirosoma koreense]
MAGLPYISEGYRRTYYSATLPTPLGKEGPQQNCIVPVTGVNDEFYVCHARSVEYFKASKKNYQTAFNRETYWSFFTIGHSLYYFHPNGTLTHISQSGNRLVHLTGDVADQGVLAGKQPELFWNHASNQTFLYLNQKLYGVERVAPDKLTTRLLLDGFDMKQHNIRTIYHDQASGRIFLGSMTEGLFVFSPKPFETLTTKGNEMENVFYGQTPFDNGQVVMPTGLVLGKNASDHQPISFHLPALAKANEMRRYGDNYSLLIDKNRYIWIKKENLLLKFDPEGKRQLSSWNLGDGIKSIYQGVQGGPIWIGTIQKGVYQIDPTDPQSVPTSVTGLVPAHVSYFQYATPELLLIGTEQGLYQFHIRTHKLELSKGTEKLFIRSIYAPRSDEIWFTTYNNGLFLLQNHRLTRFPLDENGYLASSHYIFEDKKGYVWVPTNKGLFQMARQDLLEYARAPWGEKPFYLYYAKDQGFLTNEFNGGGQPGIVRLANGYVSMPSLLGLVWFTPEQLSPQSPDKLIILDRIEANKESINVLSDTVRLPLDAKQIKLRLTTPYFGNPKNLHWAYQVVENQNNSQPADWIGLSSQDPTVLISSLGVGTYTLHIRKENGFGRNNYQYKQVFLIVPPHWYETAWMRFVFILLAIGLIYVFTRLRFQAILNENLKLERLVADRTASLQTAMSQLQSSEQELSRQLHLQSQLMASISHDIQSPLRFVSNTSRRIWRWVQTQKYDNLPEMYKFLEETMETIAGTSQHTTNLLDELLTYTRAKVYDRQHDLERIDLQTLVANKITLFEGLLTQQHNQLITEIPPGVMVRSDKHLLGIILHNLIDNAVKYTEGGQIRIFVEQIEGQLHLIVANPGMGMSSQTIAWLNEAEIEDALPTQVRVRHGVGLLLVKELAALMHIWLYVEQTDHTAVHLVFGE